VLRCLGLKFSASFSQVREARVLYFKFILPALVLFCTSSDCMMPTLE